MPLLEKILPGSIQNGMVVPQVTTFVMALETLSCWQSMITNTEMEVQIMQEILSVKPQSNESVIQT